jgi:predicted TIM-barrel fold metal-dependent hydrolase
MDRLIVVSGDSHAQPPPDVWDTYVEPRYRDLLPRLRGENVQFTEVMGRLFVDRTHADAEVFDLDGTYRTAGLEGLWDLDARLAQMDREGVAAELVYNGDSRITGLFFQPSNARYADDVCEAGVRAHHRWAHDVFGSASDRVLLAGVTGHAPCRGMDATMAETRWLADHGYVAIVAPGMTGYADQPPLHDPHYDPLWALCVELGFPVIVHAGWGPQAGGFFDEIARVHTKMVAAGGPTDELLAGFTNAVMATKFFSSVGTRRPLWQMALGGVFDRHPDLRVLLTEIRADWLPALLGHLDALWEQHRDQMPARRRPSEYWATNCLTCLSFAHRAEVEMRDEIGVDTLAFGRDYPHPEGTWPNSLDWIRAAFAGVGEQDLRKVLGENLLQFLRLDRDHLAGIASRIGPRVDDLLGTDPALPDSLIDHFDRRGGYLKPAERDERMAEVDELIDEDLGGLLGSPA